MASETEKKPATRKRKATTTARKTATATTRRKAAPAAKTGLSWSTACRDWEKRIIAGESLVPCDPLFPDAAAQGMAVFNALKIVDVLGEPTIGESCRDWLKDFAAAIFGSYDPETGKRMITEFFLLVSKKNTKSTTGLDSSVTVNTGMSGAEFVTPAWMRRKAVVDHESLDLADVPVLEQILIVGASGANVLFVPDPDADGPTLNLRSLFGRIQRGDLSNPYGAALRQQTSFTITERL